MDAQGFFVRKYGFESEENKAKKADMQACMKTMHSAGVPRRYMVELCGYETEDDEPKTRTDLISFFRVFRGFHEVVHRLRGRR